MNVYRERGELVTVLMVRAREIPIKPSDVALSVRYFSSRLFFVIPSLLLSKLTMSSTTGLTVEEIQAQLEERRKLRAEANAKRLAAEAKEEEEFAAQLARVEAEKVEAEKRRAEEKKKKEEEKKRKEAELEQERLRVEDSQRKAKVKAILANFPVPPTRQVQERERSVVRAGKRKAVVVDDEEEDSETPVPEGPVSNRFCLGPYIY